MSNTVIIYHLYIVVINSSLKHVKPVNLSSCGLMKNFIYVL
jgi:hypothetical protein